MGEDFVKLPHMEFKRSNRISRKNRDREQGSSGSSGFCWRFCECIRRSVEL